jgi:CxxC-x17-CxxC domain-containing protein
MASDEYPYTTVCAECGNVTKIPFIPDGVKSVYCSECLCRMHKEEPKVNTKLEFYKILKVKLDKH